MTLSQSLIIGVAAGAGAAILILCIVLYHYLRRPKQQVPLPPKQELARYREQGYAAGQSRPGAWFDAGKLSAPPTPYGGSRSSLVPPPSRGDSRRSFHTSESPSEELSLNVPPLPLAAPPELLPHLSFDTSSTSLSTAEIDPCTLPESSFTPRSHQHRTPSSSSSRPSGRPRPLSVGSSSAMSRNSRNLRPGSNPTTPAIRGLPHGPHSAVQIVLPAPLGLSDRMSVYEPQRPLSHRYSVVDQWAPAAIRSSEPNPIPKPHGRPSSISGARRSSSHSSLRQQASQAPHPQRNSSVPPPSSYSPRSSHVPPVPQLPASVTRERGRSISREGGAQAPPLHKPTTEKRSRSRGGA